MTKKVLSMASAMLIAASLSTQAGVGKVGNIGPAEKAKGMLQDMETQAVQTEKDADQLKSYILDANVDWETHLGELIALKSEINRMGKELAGLQNERESLPTWEQHALDKVQPLLKDSAMNTNQAIGYFNENKGHLWAPEYRDETNHIFDDSEQISKILHDYLKLAKARHQEEELRNSLGVTGE